MINGAEPPFLPVDSWHAQGKSSLTVFLGVFRALGKATISFVMSVCPSVRPHGTTRFPPYELVRNFDIFTVFRKSVQKIQVALKSGKNNVRVLYVKTDIHF